VTPKIFLKKSLARLPKRFDSSYTVLHLGCGKRKYQGFLNVDLWGSDFNLDLSRGSLPFPDNQFQMILSQHFIEHLELETELIPLMNDLYRIVKPGGIVILSTPDIKKITRAYIDGNLNNLIRSRKKRFKNFSLNGLPNSHYLNLLFHQNGEHKNLFDFELLSYVLKCSGFSKVKEISERKLIAGFPTITPRNDMDHTIIVQATKPDNTRSFKAEVIK